MTKVNVKAIVILVLLLGLAALILSFGLYENKVSESDVRKGIRYLDLNATDVSFAVEKATAFVTDYYSTVCGLKEPGFPETDYTSSELCEFMELHYAWEAEGAENFGITYSGRGTTEYPEFILHEHEEIVDGDTIGVHVSLNVSGNEVRDGKKRMISERKEVYVLLRKSDIGFLVADLFFQDNFGAYFRDRDRNATTYPFLSKTYWPMNEEAVELAHWVLDHERENGFESYAANHLIY